MIKQKEAKTSVTRRRILDSAVEVLKYKEFHECLIDEVARNAGVGKGTVYLYFKSKEDLYVSLLVRLIDEMREIVDGVPVEGVAPEEQLRTLIGKLYEFMGHHGPLLMVLREEKKPAEGPLKAQVHESFDGLLEAISAIVARGIAARRLRDYPPLLISSLLVSSLIAASRFKGKGRPGAAAVSPELIADIVLRGIGI